jgi:hypothetical protein
MALPRPLLARVSRSLCWPVAATWRFGVFGSKPTALIIGHHKASQSLPYWEIALFTAHVEDVSMPM